MKAIKKQLVLNKVDYFEKHLNIIKPFIPKELTPKEIKVLAVFMSFEGELAKDRFGPTARKMVMDIADISAGGLGNYLRALKDKEFLKEAGGNMEIWPILFPEEKEQVYMFKIIRQ